MEKNVTVSYITMTEALRKYRVSRDRLYAWRKLGCPFIQLAERGRNLFPEDELDAWVRERFGRGSISKSGKHRATGGK